MNLVTMTIPDDPAQLAGWLERLLVGPDLGRLAAELAAIHGADSAPVGSVSALLGSGLERVLVQGLGVLPRELLGRLLRQPACLLELQELVLTEGGPYWDRLPVDPELERLAERGLQRLQAEWGGAPLSETTLSLPARRSIAWYRRPWAVSLATAAAVLLAVYAVRPLWMPKPAQPEVAAAPHWGWDRPDALPAEGPAAAYLDRLAEAADEWFKQRPADRVALAKRIGEFRQGCSTLLLADHPLLNEADRRWLLKKCRNWANRFEQYLAALEDRADPAEVRQEMDTTVRQLIEALRQRAKELRAV